MVMSESTVAVQSTRLTERSFQMVVEHGGVVTAGDPVCHGTLWSATPSTVFIEACTEQSQQTEGNLVTYPRSCRLSFC